MNKDLEDLLIKEAYEINSSFEKASIEGRGTPQEVSDRNEETFISFIKKYYPFPYKILKGNVIDSYGKRSNSIDCLILNPCHPYTIDARNKKASIIFADGVDAAIEIKTSLDSKKEINRALLQIQSIKQLTKKKVGIISKDDRAKEFAHKIPGIIFANKTYSNIKTLFNNIIDVYERENIPREEQFDFIAINNRVVVYNVSPNSYCNIIDNTRGMVYFESKEKTLMCLLFILSQLPKSELEMGESIMSIYLEGQNKGKYISYIDCNERLNNIDMKNDVANFSCF